MTDHREPSHIDDRELRRALQAAIARSARAARKTVGLTQERTAEAIDVSTEFYARVERGRTLPSVSTLRAMADTLDITVDRLLGLDERDGPSAADRPPAAIAEIVARVRHRKTWSRLVVAAINAVEN